MTLLIIFLYTSIISIFFIYLSIEFDLIVLAVKLWISFILSTFTLLADTAICKRYNYLLYVMFSTRINCWETIRCLFYLLSISNKLHCSPQCTVIHSRSHVKNIANRLSILGWLYQQHKFTLRLELFYWLGSLSLM